jgi:hypothetical protein
LADSRFLCPGTKGSHIRNIIKFSGSSVKIAAAEEEAATEATGGESPAAGGGTTTEHLRKVTVVGTPESQWKAQYLIFEKLREEGFNQGMEDVKLTVEIMVPSSQVRLSWLPQILYSYIPLWRMPRICDILVLARIRIR